MFFVPTRRLRRLVFPGAMLLIIALIFASMCILGDVDPAAYKYKSYLYQAQAWLQGEFALDRNYEYLELAVYDGRYYVSFPPVPAIPMLLYSLIWGDDVPGGLFQKIYIAIAALIVLSEIRRTKKIPLRECAAWALFISLASAMLPITLIGGVWYEAQILAFLLSVSAIALVRRRRMLSGCLCYALSVGCRPFTVLLGPVLLAMYIEDTRAQHIRPAKAVLRLVPGLLAGLAVAAAYAAYNYARFGDIFEFGHNYLPEFTRAEHGQLSLRYIASNWRTLFFGPPFSVSGTTLSINQFGFSMFLSCPLLLCGVVWFLQDLIRRRLTPTKLLILLMSAANVLLLLMHRTLGGHQFGARYALELIPLSYCYLLLSPNRKKLSRWESVLFAFGLAFNFIGGCLVHV